ncbi:hypothetical protein Nepgr_025494 [Nepenthes gracilis]|uniref:Uncharacterized protein n=1 Tax=Nepenthes gracilis TaxID=150966 RepID=A0AAD3T6U1_NEPGR|nr:hypothetical protein Nepgr_025494 [Nepenthes gracilis]
MASEEEHGGSSPSPVQLSEQRWRKTAANDMKRQSKTSALLAALGSIWNSGLYGNGMKTKPERWRSRSLRQFSKGFSEV